MLARKVIWQAVIERIMRDKGPSQSTSRWGRENSSRQGSIFSKRGAYPKFKALLARRRAIERWHAFEAEATEQALREWCALDSIEIIC